MTKGRNPHLNMLRSLDPKIFYGFHAIFLITAFIVVLMPLEIESGYILLMLVIIYNLISLFYVLTKGREILPIWYFSFTLSLFMVFPDWILAEILGVLVFPSLGELMIGPIPIYMAFLWTIPVNMITYTTFRISEILNYSPIWINMCATFLFLVSSEFYSHMIGAWEAQNVTKLVGAAIYILPAEILYGFSIWYALRDNPQSYWNLTLRSFLVMVFYVGAAIFSYHLFEIILLN